MIDSIHALKEPVFDKVYKTWILNSYIATERDRIMLILRTVFRKAAKNKSKYWNLI